MTLPPHARSVHAPVGHAFALRWPSTLAGVATAMLLLVPASTRAHCDTLDGPVVKTARVALDTKDVRPVLAWVKRAHEAEVRAAFFEALAARKARPTDRDASDLAFFETLVRVHRAGEGAPFTGLKPDGTGVGAVVREADRAIDEADVSTVEQLLVEAIREGVRDHFARVRVHEPPGKDVVAGRAWVDAYVEYVHYVEQLEAAARGGAAHPGTGHRHAAHGGASHVPASDPGTTAAQLTTGAAR